NQLYDKIAVIIEQSRQNVVTAVNLTMVYTYYEIGRYIVEDEQQGEQRAKYGKSVLKELSARLAKEFGKGFSERNLEQMRFFYQTYSKQISQTVFAELQETNNQSNIISPAMSDQLPEKSATVLRKLPFTLSWSHYLVLMREENPDARRFYEIEAAKQQWSVRQLAHQCASSLYERLALSRDKKEVMRLANEGQIVEKPKDVLKNPLVLNFLEMEEKSTYTETQLETAIIDKLQLFLLEMGKGFLFEARQKRFTFDEEHFYVDLVLYNRLLQCYVLIDLKTKKLKHQDLGQMQMYVNYFDREVKLPSENPTIGILLCKQKNDSVVELTLPDNANIYASQYSLYLPDKQLLQSKLTEWVEEFEDRGC
ncbi:MAG: PDDEXK nuclease domain-containing protein, partial [Bacteroidales bacterium]|nr:PDDEXK nuclease domain-containing protein [Bacteroidales bacterium]